MFKLGTCVKYDCYASGQKSLNNFEDQTSLRLNGLELKTVVNRVKTHYTIQLCYWVYFQIVVLDYQVSGRLLKVAPIGQWNIKHLICVINFTSNEEKLIKSQTTLKYWNLLQQLSSFTAAHLLFDAVHEHTGNSRSGLILSVTSTELNFSLCCCCLWKGKLIFLHVESSRGGLWDENIAHF